jgi:hypothetical protein
VFVFFVSNIDEGRRKAILYAGLGFSSGLSGLYAGIRLGESLGKMRVAAISVLVLL